MLQLQHMHRIVQACFPENNQEAKEIWNDIKPIKFGATQPWITDAAITLAIYQVPEDAAYLLILRTECYVTTFDPTAVGFGQFSPPPDGTASWQYTDVGVGNTQYRITPVMDMNILLDCEEFLFAKGDHLVTLVASVTAPDAVERFIRTLVYGYLISAEIAGRLGGDETVYFSFTV
jgi:hypothetical protein